MLVKFLNSKKITGAYALVFFLIIAAIVWLTYYMTTSYLRRELIGTNIALVKQLAEKTDMLLHEVDRNSIHLILDPAVKPFMEDDFKYNPLQFEQFEELTKKLTMLMHANYNISSVYLYSTMNQTVLSNTTKTSIIDFFDKSWLNSFNRMENYHEWLGAREVTIGTSGSYPINRNYITLVRSYPLISRYEFRKGAIILNIDTQVLNNLLAGANSGRLGYSFILDQQGNLITDLDSTWMNANELPLSVLSQTVAADREGYDNLQIAGQKTTVFYTSSTYTGWKFVGVVPNVKFNKPLVQLLRVLFIVAAILFLIALLLILVIGNWSAKPLDAYIKNIRNKLGLAPARSNGNKNLNHFDRLQEVVGHVLVNNEKLHKQMLESLPALKWRLMMDIFTGTNKSIALSALASLDIELYSGSYVVMIADYDQKSELGSARDLHLFAYALCNVAEELINAENKGVAIQLIDGKVAILASYPSYESENVVRLLSVAELLSNFVKQQFNKTISIGIGSVQPRLNTIQISYREALEAIKYRLILGNNSTISIEDIPKHDISGRYRLYSYTDGIAEALKSANKYDLDKRIDSLFAKITKQNTEPEFIRHLCFQLLMKSINTALDIGVENEVIRIPDRQVQELLTQSNDVAQLKCYISGVLNDLISLIKEKRNARGKNDQHARILRYINDHYMDSDLSLNFLADHYGLSVPYMSRVIKEYAECNFMDYLIAIRMDKAKELLTQGGSSIAEIAAAVGYVNYNSFNRIFKKYTGMTPGEYRESGGESAEGDVPKGH